MFQGEADALVADRELQLYFAFASGEGSYLDNNRAADRELERITEQVGKNLAEAQVIADQHFFYADIYVVGQFHALLFRLFRQQVGQSIEHIFQNKGKRLHIQLACLDLGEVEDVIDDAQQGIRCTLDLDQIVALLGGQRCFQAELGHANDGVHRRSDLVAHVGQE